MRPRDKCKREDAFYIIIAIPSMAGFEIVTTEIITFVIYMHSIYDGYEYVQQFRKM